MQTNDTAQDDFCRGCSQANQCRTVYEKLGNSKNPSVAKKVTVALLLPLLIFICSAAVTEAVFDKLIKSKGLAAVVALAISLSITYIAVLLIKVIEKRLKQTGKYESSNKR